VPDAYFFVTDTLLIFDHLERRIKIVANAHVVDPVHADAAYDDAVKLRSRNSRRKPRRVPCPVARYCPSITDVRAAGAQRST
jgi:anthranilate/para-aminobenzoate synthase component I